MLRPARDIARVYLHRAPVDMRKQIDGLAILAKDMIRQDPTSGALFGFINARRNKLKLLVWEKNGFIVWYKRLEKDKFTGRGITMGTSSRLQANNFTGYWMATMCGE
jgi:hypothetical protein